jgi:hypothetical protein
VSSDFVTSILDVLALLLFAAGCAAAAALVIGWAALAVGGLVVFGGSQTIAHINRPQPAAGEER